MALRSGFIVDLHRILHGPYIPVDLLLLEKYTPFGLRNEGALHVVACVYSVIHVIKLYNVPPKKPLRTVALSHNKFGADK